MSFPNTDQSSNTYSTNPTRGQNEFDNDNSATEFNQQRIPGEQQQGYSGNTTDASTVGSSGGGFNNTEAFGARRQQGQGRDEFAGNTTDANTFGAGGDFGDTGRQGGQQRDLRDDSFDRTSRQASGGEDFGGEGFGHGGDEGQTRNKPTMGERVKGTMQQAAGGITGNKAMQERGKELKQGDFDQQDQEQQY